MSENIFLLLKLMSILTFKINKNYLYFDLFCSYLLLLNYIQKSILFKSTI